MRDISWKEDDSFLKLLDYHGGNHHMSIFRLIVGTALIAPDGLDFPTWNQPSRAPDPRIDALRRPVEYAVSAVIDYMPFICLDVSDEAGRDSCRRHIEPNAIALLSDAHHELE